MKLERKLAAEILPAIARKASPLDNSYDFRAKIADTVFSHFIGS